MKRYILFLWVLAAMCLLSACGSSSEVSVYVVETEALYTSALDAYEKGHPDVQLTVEQFDSYEAMNERLNTELMSGEGPDLLLFNSLYSDTDVLKLAGGSAFLSLNEYTDALTENDCYPVLLEGGKINGEQYLLPLSWNLLQAYTSKSLMEGYEGQSLYDAVTAEAQRLADSEDTGATSLQFGRGDALNFFLEIGGVPVVDMNEKTFAADSAQVQRTAEFVKMFYDNMTKISAIAQRYRNDFSGAVSHYSFLLENYPFMNNLRYYQTLYPDTVGEEMAVSFFGELDSQDSLSAQIIHYGAISANTDNPEGAWEVLRSIMEADFSMDFSKYDSAGLYYAPVTPEAYEACVVQLETSPGQGPNGTVEPLNEENGALLRQIPGRVTEAGIRNPVLGDLIQECMEPYLTGSDSFENCYATLESRVSLYLDE